MSVSVLQALEPPATAFLAPPHHPPPLPPAPAAPPGLPPPAGPPPRGGKPGKRKRKHFRGAKDGAAPPRFKRKRGFSHAHHQQQQQHSRGPGSFAVTPPAPGTCPHAPLNTTSFLMTTSGGVPQLVSPSLRSTPSTLPGDAGGGAYSRPDGEDAAGLDFFGTNAGLVSRKADVARLSSEGESTSDESDSDPGEPGRGYHLNLEALQSDEARLPPHIRARLDDQSTYIAELEESVLNLRERLYLANQELADMHCRLRGEARPNSDGDRSGDDAGAVKAVAPTDHNSAPALPPSS